MRDQLVADIQAAKEALNAAEKALAAFDESPENNRFSTVEDAAETIEDKLRDKAGEDCEGSYNCGFDQYVQDFYVGDVLYRGTLDVEYNRHDKTYYYVEYARFSFEEVK